MAASIDYEDAGYSSSTEMWIALVFNWIAFFIIWIFWIHSMNIFCIGSNAAKCKNFSPKQITQIESKYLRTLNSEPKEDIIKKKKRSESLGQVFDKISFSATALKSSILGIEQPDIQINVCKIKRNLRLLFLSSITCSALYISSQCLTHIIVIFTPLDGICAINKYPIIFIALQRLSLYTFFIARIHYSFANTIYAINIKILYALEILCVLSVVLNLVNWTVTILISDYHCRNKTQEVSMYTVLSDSLIFIVLLVVFLRRITNAIHMKNVFVRSSSELEIFQALEKSNASRSSSQRIIVRDARNSFKYYYVSYKIFVLFCTTTVLTWIAFVISILSNVFSSPASYDSIISSFMLFLAFSFNDRHYRRFYCGCLKIHNYFLGKEYAMQMEAHFIKPLKKRSIAFSRFSVPNNLFSNELLDIPAVEDRYSNSDFTLHFKDHVSTISGLEIDTKEISYNEDLVVDNEHPMKSFSSLSVKYMDIDRVP